MANHPVSALPGPSRHWTDVERKRLGHQLLVWERTLARVRDALFAQTTDETLCPGCRVDAAKVGAAIGTLQWTLQHLADFLIEEDAERDRTSGPAALTH